MASKSNTGNGILSPKRFGLLLGFIIFLVFTGFFFLGIFDGAERRTLDAHFGIKNTLVYSSRNVMKGRQEGRIDSNYVSNISNDIVLIGIDNQTLINYGRWPFNRSVHADLLNAINRISDQNLRESVTFLDFLFFNTAEPAYGDVRLLDAIDKNGNVLLQTQLHNVPVSGAEIETPRRMETLYSNIGRIENVSGEMKYLKRWYGLEGPLIPYGEVISSYGYANYIPDNDDIFRHVVLLSAYSDKVAEYRVEDISQDTVFPVGQYGHITYTHKSGITPVFQLPLTEESLEELLHDISRYGVERNAGQGDYYLSAYTDTFLPSTPLSLALKYFNKNLEDIEVELGSHILIKDPMRWDGRSGEWIPYSVSDGRRNGTKILDEIRIPIDDNGRMIINFMGRRSSTNPEIASTFPVRSYTRITERTPGMNEDDWPKTKGWDGKILMVGAFTNAMADDEKATPMGMMFGVEMQANALNTIIMDNFVKEVSYWWTLGLMFLMILIVTVISTRTDKMGWSVFVLALLILATFITVTLLFTYQNLLLEWFTPAIASAVVFVVIVIYRVLSAERDKRQIKNVFGQFISPTIVEELSSSNALPELGGENRDVTVFFSDIRDFSGLSEKKNDPQELVSLLNDYLTDMTDNIVINFKGTLDKYIGDAIMAIWGAPQDMSPEEHAILACKSSLMQIELLGKLNTRLKESAGDGPADNLDIGIGVHSGECMVGYMGSEGRKNYTAMGDTVNLSSRLEGVNKKYRTRIIISDETRKRIQSEPFIVRELDQIRVKGRFTPVTIYELVDYDGELYTEPEPSRKGKKDI